MFRVQISSDELLVRRSVLGGEYVWIMDKKRTHKGCMGIKAQCRGGWYFMGPFFFSVKTTCLNCHQLERSVVGTTFFWHESGVEN